MEGRALIQYIIDISEVTVQKKQEATEYLAKLEVAQQGDAQKEFDALGEQLAANHKKLQKALRRK